MVGFGLKTVHQSGLAVDMRTQGWRWLTKNAHTKVHALNGGDGSGARLSPLFQRGLVVSSSGCVSRGCASERYRLIGVRKLKECEICRAGVE